ncbi:MAG TPA: AMP-binding protein [Hyphomicrobium sp.]|nr:AMP-binding protein [Hyphomicrobium sp.]
MKAVALYHRLPYPLRCASASARGLYLRRWRYNASTDAAVAEILSRETWSPEQWQAWTAEELARLLHRAETRVPWYREHWARRRRQGDRRSSELLENWPVLEKAELRANPRAFLADDCRPSRMFGVHTSGTTGTPVHILQSHATVLRQYALMEARWRGWNGVSRHDRWATISGQLVTPVTQDKPPYWVWNAGLRQLYMSAYHLSPAAAEHYRAALVRHKVRYIWGYPSGLHALAEDLLARGLTVPNLKVVITVSEPLLDVQRDAIERAFGCPVVESYGMTEAVLSASQCRHGALHLWPESGVLEVVDGTVPLAPGQAGEFLATGLNNPDMPLIRYRTGDRGALSTEAGVCACGRTLPRLARVEGRSDDVLYTADGRRVGRLDPVFKAHLPIREAQIVQETLERLRVRYIPAPEWNEAAEGEILAAIHSRMGPVEVQFERVESIPRSANGKFQSVLCQLPLEQRQALQRQRSTYRKAALEVAASQIP